MIETEKSIIGTVLTYPDELPVLLDLLTPEDFRNTKCRTAFTWMAENNCADIVALTQGSKLSGSELVAWTEQTTIPTLLPRVCKEQRKKAQGARLIDMAREIQAKSAELSTDELLDLTEKRLSELNRSVASGAVGIKEVAIKAMKELEQRHSFKGKLIGMTTGYPALDELTTGMRPGELWIVAGRPSMGKTAFAVNVAENSQAKSLIFSLEMPREQLVERIISSQGRVPFGRIRSGRFFDTDWPKLANGVGQVGTMPVWIDDTPGVTLQYLKSVARKQKRTHGLELIVVDYLQLMQVGKAGNRAEAIGEISRGLKILARELDVTVLCLSQLSRNLENREDKRPVMADIRESGAVEQDADTILFPFRPAVYCADCKDSHKTCSIPNHQREGEVIIGKQRNGPSNVSVPMTWFGEFVRYEAREGHHGNA